MQDKNIIDQDSLVYGYKECQKGGIHNGECLNIVCFEPTCINNGVICCVCKSQEHSNHKTMPMKYLIYKIKQKLEKLNQSNNQNGYDSEENEFFNGFEFFGEGDSADNLSIQQKSQKSDKSLGDPEEILKKKKEKEEQENNILKEKQEQKEKQLKILEQLHQTQLSNIDTAISKLGNIRQNLQDCYEISRKRIEMMSQFTEYSFKKQINQFLDFEKEKENLSLDNQQISNKSKGPVTMNSIKINQNFLKNIKFEDYKRKWENISNLVTQQFDNIELSLNQDQIQQNYEKYDKKVSDYMKKLNASIEQAKSNSQIYSDDCKTKPIYQKKQNQQTLTSFISQQQTLDQNKNFSKTLKSQFVNLSSNNMIATQSTSSNQDKRFVLTDQTLSMTKPTVCKFQVIKATNWLAVGIGFRSILSKKEFKFEYGKLGMGYYLVSSNGYKWSHSKTADNIQNCGVNFKDTNQIQLTFDPLLQELKIENLTSKKSFTFKDLELKPGEDYHICVGLSSKDESIQMLK